MHKCGITISYSISAVSVGFQESTYNVTEGDTVSVCLEILEGSSGVPITISVSTTEGTAGGNKDDIVFSIQFLNLLLFPENDFNDPEPIEVMIGNGVPRSCTNIMTRDDDIYEDDESFFATLSSQYENIAFPISSASVLIVENDGNA